MRHIDLFSGIGGFALAATWVWGDEYENVGHSEVEAYPCKVYHNHFPQSECLGDITKIDWSRFAGTIDLVTGGFPCQPHSVAGKRKGSGDERDLWSECVRAIREIRPRFALFENVPGIFSSNGGRFFERVLSDISASGYDCEWQVLSAAEVGAWHRRERVWITCFPNAGSEERNRLSSQRREEVAATRRGSEIVPDSPLRQDDGRNGRVVAEAESGEESIDTTVNAGGQDVSDTKIVTKRKSSNKDISKSGSGKTRNESCLGGDVPDSKFGRSQERRPKSSRQDSFGENEDLRPETSECRRSNANAPSERLEGQEPTRESREYFRLPSECDWWATEPNVGRVAHGVSARVDRLKGLGNAIVPQCAVVIMEAIKESMK